MGKFNNEYNKEILKILKHHPIKYTSFICAKKHHTECGTTFGKDNHLHLKDYILNATKGILPKNTRFGVRILFVLNKWTECPRCESCGKKLNLDTSHFRLKFENGKLYHKRFCSGKCKMKSNEVREKTSATIRQKYGKDIENVFQSKTVIEKSRKTRMKKYGDPEYKNFEKIHETCRKKYGYPNIFSVPKIKEKIQKTFLERYSVNRPAQSSEIRSKMRRKYYYDGQTFDSSWEVAFYIFHKDNGLVLKHEPTAIEYFDSKGEKTPVLS